MSKLKSLLDLAALVSDEPTAAADTSVDGYAIVIADRGHVWVGATTVTNDWVTIADARAIRRWGTTQGLNELAQKGPLAETKLDAASTVRVSRKAVIALIPTESAKWTS